MQIWKVIGSVPPEAEGKPIIMHAPRPILGYTKWRGDFFHGRFYVAISPEDYNWDHFVRKNDSLDAYALIYVTRDQALEEARSQVKLHHPDYDLSNISDEILLHSWNRLTYMDVESFIALQKKL